MDFVTAHALYRLRIMKNAKETAEKAADLYQKAVAALTPEQREEFLRHVPAEPLDTRHDFVPGGDDSTFGGAGTWCAFWLTRHGEEDQCGLPKEAHSPQ